MFLHITSVIYLLIRFYIVFREKLDILSDKNPETKKAAIGVVIRDWQGAGPMTREAALWFECSRNTFHKYKVVGTRLLRCSRI